jgi:subtilisin family serine protease
MPAVASGSSPVQSGAPVSVDAVVPDIDAAADAPGVAPENGSGTATGNDTTVDVVVIFVNDTARHNVSFGPNVTVTGGEEVEVAPVLFATVGASALPALRARPDVESVGIDRRVALRRPAPGSEDGQAVTTTTTATGSASKQTVSWGIRRIGVTDVNDSLRTAGTRGVNVAVVDTGINYTHPDLGDSVVWGANFTYGSERYGISTADDNSGHGTAVAGIIAARDNDRGVVGVAPGVRLYSIKALRAGSVGTISSLIKGIDAAVAGPDGVVGTNDDADIVQMSVGTTVDSVELASVVDAASEHAVLVGSAGNLGDGDPETGEVTYPAAFPGVVAVAATDRDDRVMLFSSEGAVDLAAPGTSVTTLAVGSGTVEFTGTSAAAPHVAGAAAVLIAANRTTPGNLTATEVRALVENASRDIGDPGPDRTSGQGLLRADRAVGAVFAGTATRTIAESNLSAGGRTVVTVTARAADDALTVSESFTPSLAAAEVETVRVDGVAITPLLGTANENRSTVTIGGLAVGDRVAVTYTVRLPDDASTNETYAIAGTVSNGETETALAPTELTVRTESNDTIVPVYDDDDDGAIDLSELGEAAADYANGEISIVELGAVARVYAMS